MERKLNHGCNPILRWQADNVVVKMDPAGNLKPDKAGSKKR
jgi:phage terminase large subunit-like protein